MPGRDSRIAHGRVAFPRLSAAKSIGDILARERAIGILPDSHVSGSVLPTLSVNNAIVPELDFTYMMLDNVGVELILGPSRHQLTSNLGYLGGVGAGMKRWHPVWRAMDAWGAVALLFCNPRIDISPAARTRQASSRTHCLS